MRAIAVQSTRPHQVLMATAALVLALLLLAAALAPPARAATITVNTTSMAVANDGQCSLIEAIIAANTDTASGNLPGECPAGSGADTIVLANATYVVNAMFDAALRNGLPPVTSAITIEGNGAVIERPAAAPFFRLWSVNSTGDLTLNDVTLRGGLILEGDGAGIYVTGGALVANRSTFANSTAQAGQGGGVHVAGGSLSFDQVTMSGNNPSALGGTNADLTITGTAIHENAGHGIELYGVTTLRLVESTVSKNHRNGVAGPLLQQGHVTILDSQLDENGERALELANSQIAIQNSAFRENQPAGGLSLISSTTVITETLISNNVGRAILSNGGSLEIRQSTVMNNAAAQGFPGGMDSRGAAVEMVGSTFAGNTPMNITHSGQTLRITNSTLSGAGVQVTTHENARLEIVHSTLVVVEGNPPAILAMGGVTEVTNSIIDRCVRGPFEPVFISHGYNIDRTNQCSFTATGDMQMLDPDAFLGPLADNGGPTLTRALLPAAAAIDAIPIGVNGCQPGSSVDQRGLPRAGGPGQGGGACDIGAFEVQGAAGTPTATPTNTPAPTATPTQAPPGLPLYMPLHLRP